MATMADYFEEEASKFAKARRGSSASTESTMASSHDERAADSDAELASLTQGLEVDTKKKRTFAQLKGDRLALVQLLQKTGLEGKDIAKYADSHKSTVSRLPKVDETDEEDMSDDDEMGPAHLMIPIRNAGEHPVVKEDKEVLLLRNVDRARLHARKEVLYWRRVAKASLKREKYWKLAFNVKHRLHETSRAEAKSSGEGKMQKKQAKQADSSFSTLFAQCVGLR